MLSRTNGGCYIKPLCSHAYFFSRNRRPYRGVNLPGFLRETRKRIIISYCSCLVASIFASTCCFAVIFGKNLLRFLCCCCRKKYSYSRPISARIDRSPERPTPCLRHFRGRMQTFEPINAERTERTVKQSQFLWGGTKRVTTD